MTATTWDERQTNRFNEVIAQFAAVVDGVAIGPERAPDRPADALYANAVAWSELSVEPGGDPAQARSAFLAVARRAVAILEAAQCPLTSPVSATPPAAS